MKIQKMFRKSFAILVLGVVTISAGHSQEFSISGGSNNSIPGGLAFDGTNYLIGLTGDATSDSNISVQFVSTTGQLVGSRIPLGETGCPPSIAFDGTNYLLIWCDRYVAFLDNGDDAGLTNIYGRFMDPTGSFVGNKFTIETGAYIKGCSIGNVHFNGTDYFFTYREDDGGGDIGLAYGRFISTTGTLLGLPIQISSGVTGGTSMAFDGTNYLVVFELNAQSIYGQFISAAGSLVGVNFLIDNSPNLSDNPVSVVYGGSKYLVAYHDQQGGGSGWNLFGYFVSTAGSVESNRITICDSTQGPMIGTLAFDGTNYLTAWISLNTRQIRGQFLDTTGAHFNSEFVIFDSVASALPLGGVTSFAANQYLAACTRIAWAKGSQSDNTNLGIFGKFIDESTSIYENSGIEGDLSIYPNPACDKVTIDLDAIGDLDVRIYSILGDLIKSESVRSNNRQINVGYLKNGAYIIEIISAERSIRKELIIQK